ncbi:hypothetical protein LVD15_02620 [Fulvivirga maritima]|uniref:hypothetical protein n=1 Tax=Fulvivirga maritima TaxID=2904247 RepID=UPI001F286074|nr:hypothetical protein [Fulvivirga maritima]UII27341.1 hypothetical protein LVD15_02620 [Fulvivirga maritima]
MPFLNHTEQMQRILLVMGGLLMLLSCEQQSKPEIAFYHWKARAQYSNSIKQTLEEVKAKRIFLHYFDVDDVANPSRTNDGLYPVYVLREVDSAYKNYDIIPVVFITNEAIKKSDVVALADRIHKLTDQISEHHFSKRLEHIQVDCDWTPSTREKYFELLTELKKYYQLSATIRLHQIKYPKETGVPPVDEGVLMLYNMGKLDDDNNNSILESKTVADYINAESSYPMELQLALPVFSQMVVKNKANEIRLINHVDKAAFTSESAYFEKIGENLYGVKQDTLFHSFYLTPGFKIKLERVKTEEILNAYQMIKKSQLKIKGVIFYHLDDEIVNNVDIRTLAEQL